MYSVIHNSPFFMNGKKLLWYDDIKKTITMINIVLGIIVVVSLNLKFSK